MDKPVQNKIKKSFDATSFMKLFIQYYRFVIIILVLGILGVGYLLAVKPMIVFSENDSDDKQEELLALREQHLNSLKELQSVYDDINSQDLFKLEFMLPLGGSVPDVLNHTENLVRSSGFDIAAINVAPVERSRELDASLMSDTSSVSDGGDPGSGDIEFDFGLSEDDRKFLEINNRNIGKLDIDLSLSGGGYYALKDLLIKLEKDQRFFNISSLGFGGSDNYSLSLVTYYLYE